MRAGTLLHKALESVYTISDFDTAITKLKANNNDLESQIKILSQNFKDSLKDPIVESWFTPSEHHIILTELTLSSPNDALEYRPDRMIIDRKQNSVTVIDYKFGEILNKHRYQVANYMQRLQQIGFSHTKGYIWYQLKNK